MGKVKSISQLKEICQKGRSDTLFGRYVRRKTSIYITWLLLHTPISANQVTFLSIIAGMTGVSFLAVGGMWWSLIGVLILNVYSTLDYVDGEVARYRDSTSITGLMLDRVGHHLVNPSIFLALGYGVYRIHHQSYAILLGAVAALAMFLYETIDDVKYSVLAHSKVEYHLYTLNEPKKKRNNFVFIIKAIVFPLSYSCKLTGAEILIPIAALTNQLPNLVLFYGIAMPIRWLFAAYRSIKQIGYIDATIKRGEN